MASAGAKAGFTARVPAQLAELIERVVSRFAEARQEIKRQALAAGEAGAERVSLVLELPLAVADAAVDYLNGLDQADAYAHAARLLTLESPPEYKVFRRWYVEALVHQLRRAAAGAPFQPPPTLESRLIAELRALSATAARTDRAAGLQQVSAALAAATAPADVAAALLGQAVPALGADAGGLLLRVDDRTVGALRFSFSRPRLFDQDERRFVLALAAETAQALDRVAAQRPAQRERARTDAAHAARMEPGGNTDR